MMAYAKAPGCDYHSLVQDGHLALIELRKWKLMTGVPPLEWLRARIERVRDAIHSVPVSVPSATLAAHSPFSAYCEIRERCRAARRRLTIVDCYLDHTVFYRYLQQLSETVTVALVTRNEILLKQPDFADLSRLYALERKASHYRLIEHPRNSLHDRHIRADDVVFQLGPSLNFAGERAYGTLSLPDAGAEANEAIDRLETSGRELFGPSQPTHPH